MCALFPTVLNRCARMSGDAEGLSASNRRYIWLFTLSQLCAFCTYFKHMSLGCHSIPVTMGADSRRRWGAGNDNPAVDSPVSTIWAGIKALAAGAHVDWR